MLPTTNSIGNDVTWIDYWNGETTIYANNRHKRTHYERVARDIISCLPDKAMQVVDYGCGEALSAQLVADRCARLFLCESAPSTRQRLAERYSGRSDIEAISPDDFACLPPGTIGAIIANSVIQYMALAELAQFLSIARQKLVPGGRLVLADVIPRRVGVLGDAVELLRFAAANGFLFAAGAGLVRSFFSSYRRIRRDLGLLQLDEPEVLELLKRAGFAAHRCRPNIGHNQRRMTFVATVPHDQS